MKFIPQYWYKCTSKKIFWGLVTFLIINSCTSIKPVDIKRYTGLYEIVDSECNLGNSDFNPCKNTLFFELLQGQFMGIKDHELAYVFWSGDPKTDAELQYTSHLIRDNKLNYLSANKFWLNNSGDALEYLIFSEERLIGYHAEYKAGNKVERRTIHYKLKPVRRGNLPFVRLNYPGNK